MLPSKMPEYLIKPSGLMTKARTTILQSLRFSFDRPKRAIWLLGLKDFMIEILGLMPKTEDEIINNIYLHHLKIYEKKCFYCDSSSVVKNGHKFNKQSYLYKTCGKQFVLRK